MSYKGDIVYLKRLEECSYIDFNDGFEWDDHNVMLEDIAQAIKEGNRGTAEPYGDEWKYPVKRNEDKNFHISRVVYFVLHPEEIRDISVDNLCRGRDIFPIAIILDGWHRILAAKYLNLEKIRINYGGRADVLEYLQGKRKTIPE